MKEYPFVIMRALVLASQWHVGQLRKHPFEKIPYIEHPTGVGFLLSMTGADDETVAAGILHDVIEDCGITKEQLAEAMSPRVAELVSWVTQLPKPLTWIERKKAYELQLSSAPIEALAIAAADHIHNLQSLVTTARASESVWSLFGADKEMKIAHERIVFECIQKRLDSDLVNLYEKVLGEVEKIA